MHVALISAYAHTVALGLRYVSAFLKRNGHEVETLFLCCRKAAGDGVLTPALLDECIDRLRAADVIGVSLMTNAFHQACAVTEAVRQAGITAPIVWGGVHPTVAPEECIPVADAVCVGEGEHTMLDFVDALATGRDPARIPGMWFRHNDRVVRNAPRPLETDLDTFPFPDYDLADHWVATGKGLAPARPENLRGSLHRYRVLATRGCPHGCTFCTNAAMRAACADADRPRWVRRRSSENVIAEIEAVRRRFPTVEAVNVVDDLFFVRDEEAMARFAHLYRERVDLPIELDAHPNSVTREKVRTLTELPIALISMGIQSGSERTLYELYERKTPIRKIAEAIELFAEFKIPTEYHFLINNPYETDEDQIQTLRFVANHYRGAARLRVFPLQFYPGTPLFERARADGLIGLRHETAYVAGVYRSKLQYKVSTYFAVWLQIVLALRNRGVSSRTVHRVIDCVTAPMVRRVLDRKWFAPATYVMYRVGRVVFRNLLYQPFVRPWRYLFGKSRRVRSSVGAVGNAARRCASDTGCRIA